MTRYFTLLILLFFAAPSFAQNVNVTGSTTSSNTNYTTLNAAFAAINSGTHKGYVVVTVNGNTTETATCVLNASGTGSSLYDSVRVTSSGNYTISGAIAAGSALIDLNGADNVFFEGVNNGSISLTISNTTVSGNTGTCTIRLYNDATKNRINKCKIQGSSTMTTNTNGGNIFISTAATTGNDNNTISNCTITGAGSNMPNKGIYINGTTTSSATNNDGITISNCNFVNFNGTGIYVSTGNYGVTIANNNFYHTSLQTVTDPFSAVYINNLSTGVNFNVYGNNIGGSAANCAGSAMSINGAVQFQGIYYNGQAASPRSNIYANRIANISVNTSFATTPNNNFGIMIYGGRVNCGTTQGNVIGDSTITNSISFYNSGTSAIFYGITSNGSFTTYGVYDTIDISNNTISGIAISSSSTVATGFRGIYLAGSNPAPNFVVNNNLIGSNTISNSISSSSGSQLSAIFTQFTASSTLLVHQVKNNVISNMFIGGGSTNSSATLRGILLQGAHNFNVANNTIKNLTSSVTSVLGAGGSAAIVGILFQPSGTISQSVTGNYVYNLFTTAPTTNASITGIANNTSPSINSDISKNKVYNLIPSTTSNTIITGLYVAGGATTFSNNEINLGLDNNNNSLTNPYIIYGINELGGNNNFYFNTVAIQGSGVNNASTTIALRTAYASGTHNYRNNIFANLRSFASAGTTYNIADSIVGTISSGSITGLTQDYNLYYAPGTGGILITNNGTNYTSQSAWTTVATGHDANSLNVNPQFYSNSTLKPMNTAVTAGVAISGITTDIEGNTRTINRIGAYDNLTTLSVNIISFEGNWKQQNPNLQFTTSDEKNLSLYTIERSENGENYFSVGTIMPNGNNGSFENVYHFEDNKYLGSATNLYYRIKVTELNGVYYYGKTIQLNKNSSFASIEISPNPFTNSVKISNGTFVSINDLSGRNCNNFVQVNDEMNIINTEFLPKGYYIIKSVNVDGELINKVMQKQ